MHLRRSLLNCSAVLSGENWTNKPAEPLSRKIDKGRYCKMGLAKKWTNKRAKHYPLSHQAGSSVTGEVKLVSKVLGQMWALSALGLCPRTFETDFTSNPSQLRHDLYCPTICSNPLWPRSSISHHGPKWVTTDQFTKALVQFFSLKQLFIFEVSPTSDSRLAPTFLCNID